jgi:hypothetical protein
MARRRKVRRMRARRRTARKGTINGASKLIPSTIKVKSNKRGQWCAMGKVEASVKKPFRGASTNRMYGCGTKAWADAQAKRLRKAAS